MVYVLIFKLKQGMIHVLRCHFIAVFSKSSLSYTCINWPTPLSSQTSLSRVCGRRVANIDGYMLLKDGTLCTRFRSISSVNAPSFLPHIWNSKFLFFCYFYPACVTNSPHLSSSVWACVDLCLNYMGCNVFQAFCVMLSLSGSWLNAFAMRWSG